MVFGPASWAAHAYAQFGDVKYPPGFTHFDYVNPNAPKGGEIRLVPPIAVTNFDKFNPFTLKGTPPAGMLELVFESLLIGNSEEPSTGYGLLAEDVEVAPDGLSATFRIRKEARFSDGSAVMAADVVHSFNTLMSKQASPQFKTIFGDIKAVRALAERLVKFEFASSNRELPLVAGSVPVFSRNIARKALKIALGLLRFSPCGVLVAAQSMVPSDARHFGEHPFGPFGAADQQIRHIG